MDRVRLNRIIEKYKHLEGYHGTEVNRFIIESKSWTEATLVAASLGWHLNSWTWKESTADVLIVYDTARI